MKFICYKNKHNRYKSKHRIHNKESLKKQKSFHFPARRDTRRKFLKNTVKINRHKTKK